MVIAISLTAEAPGAATAEPPGSALDAPQAVAIGRVTPSTRAASSGRQRAGGNDMAVLLGAVGVNVAWCAVPCAGWPGAGPTAFRPAARWELLWAPRPGARAAVRLGPP